jgi:hypothetical protein
MAEGDENYNPHDDDEVSGASCLSEFHLPVATVPANKKRVSKKNSLIGDDFVVSTDKEKDEKDPPKRERAAQNRSRNLVTAWDPLKAAQYGLSTDANLGFEVGDRVCILDSYKTGPPGTSKRICPRLMSITLTIF